jgi:uncharacterized protein with NAD-binding domain and iron-sulfur cluster
MSRSAHTVAIIGGGVAGLTAAHELAERGFSVDVYERRAYFGGKAASVTIGKENPYTSGPRGLPGEHGFRFFPGWYRHLPHTMGRIPYKDRTVADNLVAADLNLLVGYDRDPVRALVRFPTNRSELKTLASFPGELLRLGLTTDDLQFFFGRLWTFLTSAEERRVKEFDNQTWWEFMDADARSQAFRDYLVVSATRNTVAAKPTEASAYTIAKIALQTLFDTIRPQNIFDRVLNGPTSEAWIGPWADYLSGLGVRFHVDSELESIELDDRKVAAVRFTSTHRIRIAKARLAFLDQLERERQTVLAELEQLEGLADRSRFGRDGDEFLDAVERLWPGLDAELPRERLEDPLDDQRWQTERAGALQRLASLGLGSHERDRLLDLIRRRHDQYGREDLDRMRGDCVQELAMAERRSTERVSADYYVFALPVEQMAYYVSRSETLQQYDPSLRRVVLLSEHVDWMAGIQFFLKDVASLTRGHIDLLDSEWALTAISQAQFWKDFDLKALGEGSCKGRVRSILSVDISAWDKKGRLIRKEAFNCDRQEIAEEVWHQLKEALNRPGRAPVLKDEMLLGWEPAERKVPRESYYLADSIIDRLDRKNQAVYDKFRSVRFNSADLIRRQNHRGRETESSFMYGRRTNVNAEPLLVNRVGSLGLRPSAKTRISNMFLAADYVKTHTHLATMESANEAARTAVNEILLAAGSREVPCEIWPLSEPFETFRKIDEVLFRRGEQFKDTYADIPVRLAAGAANAVTRVAVRAAEKLLGGRK